MSAHVLRPRNGGIAFLRIILLVLIETACTGARFTARAGELPVNFDQSWLNAVVSIERRPLGGSPAPIGTGFVLALPRGHAALVTVDRGVGSGSGSGGGELSYIRTDTAGAWAEITDKSLVDSGYGDWFTASADGIALRLIGVSAGQPPLTAIPVESCLTDRTQVTVGADLITLGFANGLRSGDGDPVVARRASITGGTATNSVLLAFVSPGNSGGPVALFASAPEREGYGAFGSTSSAQILVGMITSANHPSFATDSEGDAAVGVSWTESGLAEMIPAAAILSLVKRKDVQKQMTDLEEYRKKQAESQDSKTPSQRAPASR